MVSEEQLSLDILTPPDEVLTNLTSGFGSYPEYIIITPDTLVQYALELKAFREQKPGGHLRTAVVRTGDIYRQFSSGRLSPVAIRDFIRWAYYG